MITYTEDYRRNNDPGGDGRITVGIKPLEQRLAPVHEVHAFHEVRVDAPPGLRR